MKTYRTTQIASLIGVHPNTIRFYEEQSLLQNVPRLENGYRVYLESHLLQLRLIRLAFRTEILSNNLRGEVIDIVKTAASGNSGCAIDKTKLYRSHIKEEIVKALEAIDLTKQLLNDHSEYATTFATIGRRDAAAQIGVSIDVLRDWERNGLIEVPREGNRRQYGPAQISRLKIIAILRHAHYSQMAIRRMLTKLEQGETDVRSAIETPECTDDIISVTDRYITSLSSALGDTSSMLKLLNKML